MSEQRKRTAMVSPRARARSRTSGTSDGRNRIDTMSAFIRQEALVTAAGFKGFWWERFRT